MATGYLIDPLDFIGTPELMQAFAKLVNRVRNRVIKVAVRKAAAVFYAPLYHATPVAQGKGSKAFPVGTTRKSVGIVFRKYKRGLIQSAYIGHKFPQGAAAGWYERGTKDRMTKGLWPHSTGAMPARPFFAGVWQANVGRANAILRDTIASELNDAVAASAARFVKRRGLETL